MSTSYVSPADTAKLVRKALRAAFPGSTFFVRTSVYSGGASVDVRWTDGPTTRQVRRVVSEYEGATFDGMRDLMEYRDAVVNDHRVHFGADFIHTHRNYSEETYRAAAERVCTRWGWLMPPIQVIPTIGARAVTNDYRMQDLIWREVEDMAA